MYHPVVLQVSILVLEIYCLDAYFFLNGRLS
jgi:hypothetical protein